MFNFNELYKLKDIKYSDLFEIISPRKNIKCSINKSDYNNILTGLILSVVCHFFILISSINISNIIKENNINIGLNISGVSTSINIFSYIPVIIPIIILIYYSNLNYTNKKVTNKFNFFVCIYTIISLVVTLINLIPWISSIKIDLSFGILGLICTIFIFLGDLFIFIGTTSYASDFYNIYLDSISDKGNHPNIKIIKINTNEVSEHDFKFCPRCGTQMKIDENICPKCKTSMINSK